MIDLTRQGLIKRVTDVELASLIDSYSGSGSFLFMKENTSDYNIYTMLESGDVQSMFNTQITVDGSNNVILAPSSGYVAINKSTANYPLDVNTYGGFGEGTNKTVIIGSGFSGTNVGLLSQNTGRIISGFIPTNTSIFRYGTSGDTQGLYIDSSTGNAGLNVLNPTAKFHIKNTTNLYRTLLIETKVSDTSPIYVDKEGKVLIGTGSIATKSTRAEVYGGLYADLMKIGTGTSIFSGPITIDNTLYFQNGKIKDSVSNLGTNAILTTDSNNKLVWKTATDLGFLSGNGTQNYLAKYNTSGTTTNSIIYDNGSAIGVNTNTPTGLLDIKTATDQHVQFLPNVNGAYNGTVGIVSINDSQTNYTPLGFYASEYYFGNGNTGFGVTGAQAKIHVSGQAIISGNVNSRYTSGSTNNSIGLASCASLTSATNITALGYRALYTNATGNNNTAIGPFSLQLISSSENNSALGAYSLMGISDPSSGNTANGSFAGGYGYNGGTPQLKTLSNNSLYLGYYSKSQTSSSTTNEIVIGANAIGNGSNTTTVGTINTTDTYLYGNIIPPSSGATIGSAINYYDKIYCNTSEIDLSDARYKTTIESLTAEEIKAAKELSKEIGSYKFLSAISEKGEDARTHIGLTVQKAMDIMVKNGLDPFKYAFICYDSWPKEVIEHPAIEYKAAWSETIKDINGKTISKILHPEIKAAPAYTQVIREAGDRYSLRYTELLLFIARGFEERLSALEG